MNIKNAKQQIKNTVTAYLAKDDLGSYRIAQKNQRPVILIGPPGIGKTAIMEQIAAEMRIGLVSYSMTHHTRQSALGLPYIVKESYDGREYRVSEYTMSEIIGTVYRVMRDTGIREGILFLDEINCVSETLAPCMLQFLQYKVFGQHALPEGWIVVTAGNPPEYNRSVRDFDIATWDRLKRIDVTADFEVWKEYAGKEQVHPAILGFLEARRDDFYIVETGVSGKSFVTARGWEDLSEIMTVSEEEGLEVNEDLIGQYIQHPRVSRDFSTYYALFRKYRNDYRISEILRGGDTACIVERAKQAPFDERLTVTGLLFDAVREEMKKSVFLLNILLKVKEAVLRISSENSISDIIRWHREELASEMAAGIRDREKISEKRHMIAILEEFTGKDAKDGYEKKVQEYTARVSEIKEHTEHVFSFCQDSFGEGEEILYLVSELTADRYCSRFISQFGCESYYRYNHKLQFEARHQAIAREIRELGV